MTCMPNPQYVPRVLEFLRRHFGVRLWLDDPEGQEVGVETRDIRADELREVLLQYADAIRTELHFEQRKRLNIYVGGPLNGQPRRYGFCQRGQVIAVHISRAKWAAYVIGEDRLRAFFRGYATSSRKARLLKLQKEPEAP